MNGIALDIEQMLHLEKLGLDITGGSMYYEQSDAPLASNQWTLYVGKYGAPMRSEVCIPAYGLSDILGILNDVEYECTDVDGGYHLFAPKFWGNRFNQMAFIDTINDSKSPMMTTPDTYPLQAAYDMLCWCLENKYIKN